MLSPLSFLALVAVRYGDAVGDVLNKRRRDGYLAAPFHLVLALAERLEHHEDAVGYRTWLGDRTGREALFGVRAEVGRQDIVPRGRIGEQRRFDPVRGVPSGVVDDLAVVDVREHRAC